MVSGTHPYPGPSLLQPAIPLVTGVMLLDDQCRGAPQGMKWLRRGALEAALVKVKGRIVGAGIAPLENEGRGPDWLLDALHGDDILPDRTFPMLPYLDNPLPLHWAVQTAGTWEGTPYQRMDDLRTELASQFGPVPYTHSTLPTIIRV